MARTIQVRLAVYNYCCWAAVGLLLQLAPGVVGMVAAGDFGGDKQLRLEQADIAGASAAVDELQAPDAAAPPRNKRWSTTFGAAAGNKNSSANNAVRECNTDSDCLDVQFTSCAVDPNDRKKRCFCADGKQPMNGDCSKKPRGPLFIPALRTSCESDIECLPNAICKNNATATNPRLKICMCKDGFTEDKESCNYADLLTVNSFLLIAVSTTWIWNNRRV